jgi:hypothetical protein
MRTDLNHLRLLSIFHYVLGGLVALMACFSIIHLVIGISVVSGGFASSGPGAPPPAMGWLFIGIASLGMLFGWALAICLVIAGYCLNRQKSYIFCMVVAGFACAVQPLGTILGVFTIIVLLRPSVKELFGREPSRYNGDEDEYEDERLERRERLDWREHPDRPERGDSSEAPDRTGIVLPDPPGS